MSEQRREHRQSSYEDVYLEILTEGAAGDVVQKVITCKTVDISIGGIKLFIDHFAPVGTIMNMCVLLGESQQKFNLTTELRWIMTAADPGWFFAGFEIYENELSDYEAWKKFTAAFG